MRVLTIVHGFPPHTAGLNLTSRKAWARYLARLRSTYSTRSTPVTRPEERRSTISPAAMSTFTYPAFRRRCSSSEAARSNRSR